MTDDDKCEDCANAWEFVAYLEVDEFPRTKTKRLCAECLEKHSKALIDSWTKSEWNSID